MSKKIAEIVAQMRGRGEACYASDTLTMFFQREDWRKEDIREIQGGAA